MIRFLVSYDTIMRKMTRNQQRIIVSLLQRDRQSSSSIHASLSATEGGAISLVTVKRALSAMADAGLLAVSGAGPATLYSVTPLGRLFADIDPAAYVALEPDMRYGLSHYNFGLLPAIPDDIFSAAEHETLDAATGEYLRRTSDLSKTVQKKELERLVIELSWKSSKIEGNTYTLLDTEKLILEGKEAAGHDKSEAIMILNHKDAFTFAHEHRDLFRTLTRPNMEKLHEILVKNLGVGTGLRVRPVGVIGSRYRPLDVPQQIAEAVADVCDAVARLSSPYAKALVALLGISYIQPFEDGNKRTGRLMANALLLSHNLAPLSYRSVDEESYRAAMLVFYELNSLEAFKRLFVSQYDFAARNYAAR